MFIDVRTIEKARDGYDRSLSTIELGGLTRS